MQKPSPEDVLLGRGKLCEENDGNKKLELLAENGLEEHDTADTKSDYNDRGQKRDKGVIKQEIVNNIKKGGGRFLRLSERGRWTEVSNEEALKYVTNKFKTIRRRRAQEPQQPPRQEQQCSGSPIVAQQNRNEAGSCSSDHYSLPVSISRSIRTFDGEARSASSSINSGSLSFSVVSVFTESTNESGWLRSMVFPRENPASQQRGADVSPIKRRRCFETGGPERPQQRYGECIDDPIDLGVALMVPEAKAAGSVASPMSSLQDLTNSLDAMMSLESAGHSFQGSDLRSKRDSIHGEQSLQQRPTLLQHSNSHHLPSTPAIAPLGGTMCWISSRELEDTTSSCKSHAVDTVHIRNLLSQMNQQPDNTQIHIDCLSDVASFLTTTADEPTGLFNGLLIDIIRDVVAAMERHSASSKVQEKGCLVLCQLADGMLDDSFASNDDVVAHDTPAQPTNISWSQTSLAFAADAAIRGVVSAMNWHPSTFQVQLHGCSALLKLAECRHQRDVIRGANGHCTVINALCHHVTVSPLQLRCRLVLDSLSQDGPGACELIVGEVIGSMRLEPDNAIHQSNGLQTLVSLLGDDGRRQDDGRCQIMLNVVPSVLETMQRHVSDRTVQIYGCSLLANIAQQCPENCDQITNGIETVKAVMEYHAFDGEVLKSGCSALKYLAKASKESQLRIRKAGVVNLLQRQRVLLPPWSYGDTMKVLGGERMEENHFECPSEPSY